MAALCSCAFTGHRPAHFSFQYDESAPGCVQLKSVLEKQILRLYHRGVTDFYTGCALGVDLWAGEVVLSLKRQNLDLQLHCIIPFEGQERRWKADVPLWIAVWHSRHTTSVFLCRAAII